MRPLQLSALVMYCCTFIFGTLCAVDSACADEPKKPSKEMIRMGQVGNVDDETCIPNRGPYFFGTFDASGYSDVIYYTTSPDHPYIDSHYEQNEQDEQYGHEILSGEWASAIYYEGIATGSQAMWLTDKFLYPDWYTNSNNGDGFKVSTDPEHASFFRDDPNNPVSGYEPGELYDGVRAYDKGGSAITNGDLDIIVEYEVVDLAYGDPNIQNIGSPMAYRVPGISNTFFVKSQRYVLLQTYTIRNKKSVRIEGIEFYQLLHSHPGEEDGDNGDEIDNKAVTSIYANQLPLEEDPLASYVPYNSVHEAAGSNTVGDFRYDITQWNDSNAEGAFANHADFIGFSAAVEPDVVYHGTFFGHDTDGSYEFKPAEGPHINIENRDPNSCYEAYSDENAGAMGWYMQDLEPNEVTKITFAFMFAYKNDSQSNLTFDSSAQTSGNPCGQNSVDPTDENYDEITYNIEYSNPVINPNDPNYIGQVDNAYVLNRLPAEVDFISASPGNYIYDAQEHTCIWSLPPIMPGDPKLQLSIVVQVTQRAAPLSKFDNEAILIVNGVSTSDIVTVDVCCWQSSGTIYVDASASGYNTGASWTDAYVDLQTALTQANRCGIGSEIWVAAGYYNPTNEPNQPNVSFRLSDGIAVYGGFPEGGGTLEQRDYLNNLTWLTADIPDGSKCQNVIQAKDLSTAATIDGFIILNASGYGVAIENAALNIDNCVVTGNGAGGIISDASDPNVTWSIISNNGGIGISFADNPASTKQTSPRVTNNQISSNSDYGLSVTSKYTSIFAANNFISSNGTGASGGGVYIDEPNEPAPKQGGPEVYDVLFLQNNTIVYNNNIGIEASDDADPNIVNCIIWGHQIDVVDCGNISSSCFAQAMGTNGNISSDPEFISNDPNDYHLASNSPCIDAGSPNRPYDIAQLDLDGDDRVIDVECLGIGSNDIDIGADEYACDDVQSPMDFNGNSIVGMDDFIPMAQRWLSSTTGASDPNDLYDAWDDNVINILDFNEFISQWLWQPCWQNDTSPLWIHHRHLNQDIIRQKP